MEFDKSLKEYAHQNDVPISFDETMEFLINTINKFKCKTILEIGTAIGFGSISMAQNSCVEHIDTVELNTETFMIAKQNISSRGLENKINCINMDAKEYIESCTKTYDLIYLDGPKGQYINYLPKLAELLKPNGIIVADNVFFHGMVTGITPVTPGCRSMIKGLHKFVNEILTNSKYDAQILNIGDGVAVIRKTL